MEAAGRSATAIGQQSPWKKMGLVFAEHRPFLPTPYLVSPDTLRIYVAFVDDDLIGRVGFVDVDPDNPLRVKGISRQPVLDVGRPGTFDDNGVTPMIVVRDGNRLLMYYTGWQLSDKVRYFLFTGLAESHDGGLTFRRVQESPVLDRCDDELIVRTAIFVQPENGKYRGWYVGGSDTVLVQGKQIPSYSLRYAESRDGIHWPTSREIMRPVAPFEFGYGRPWIRPKGDGYEMWYSIRRSDCGYRIGYATSPDGLEWARNDALGLGTSASGWDSEMVAFSAVVTLSSGTYMFYNGNDYGATGFGVARLQE